jgi:16S rRNA (guanine966-N2)-methyltransferase
VRPTQDRVREALFSSLQASITGSRFLDLCAGSGAVGLEALSRGADEVFWVESDRRVFGTLKRNVRELCDQKGLELSHCYCCDAVRFLRRELGSVGFDVIFADPPYNKGGGRSEETLPVRIVKALDETAMLAPGGILVLEQGANEEAPDVDGWDLIRDKRYGGTRLFFLSREVK